MWVALHGPVRWLQVDGVVIVLGWWFSYVGSFLFFGWRFIILRKFVHGFRVFLSGKILDTIGLPIEIAQYLTAFPSLFHAVGIFFPDEWS